MKRIVAFIGYSGAGKTTLITGLIQRLVARGEPVAGIKHTHHYLNEEDKGDTGRFRRAGADPVILAGPGEAVIFEGSTTRRVPWQTPPDLLQFLAHDTVIVEGFKSFEGWPHIEVSADERPTVDEVLERLGW